MSRIAAVWHRDGAPAAAASLDLMIRATASWPVDTVDTWIGGDVGLCRWRVLPRRRAEARHAALSVPLAHIAVAADARLDNRDELARRLGLDGDGPAGPDDEARLIAAAWERWGEACPSHLMGDFAFVVWDARRRVLFCARDRAGVRPLYIHAAPHLVAAGSDQAALLALPGVPRDVDEVRVASFLVPGLADHTRTFYRHIARVPPAHTIVFSEAGARAPQAYWQLDPTRAAAPASDDEYAGVFRELFADAVRLRLHRADAIAAALSGGLDSSSVVCMARDVMAREHRLPLRTFTARFPTIAGCDEGTYVAAVVRQGGIDAREVDADRLDPLGELEAAAGPVDDRFHGASYYMHSALFAAARASGTTVFLEGMGGDVVVSHGAGRLRELLRGWRLHRLPRDLREVSEATGHSMAHLVRRALRAQAPSWARRAWHAARSRGLVGPAMITAACAGRVAMYDRLREADRAADGRGLEPVRAVHWRALTSPRFVGILETLAASSARAGIEIRDPFMDRRLVEFCLSLPASQKIRGDRTRIVVRRALRDLLPQAIAQRGGKAPLNLMLQAALQTYGRERLHVLEQESIERLAPYVPRASVHVVYRDAFVRPSEVTRARLWRLATLTLWLRREAARDRG